MNIFKRWTRKLPRRGDTLVEVMFAVGIFGMVAIGAITLMNKGIATSQTTLETTMARQEIDAQIESLRFLQSAYIAESNDTPTDYSSVWDNITSVAHMYSTTTIEAEISDFFTKEVTRGKSCAEIFDKRPTKAFVLNTRNLILNPDTSLINGNVIIDEDKILLATTYPRLLYGRDETAMSDTTIDETGKEIFVPTERLYNAEGIWVTGVASDVGGIDDNEVFQPDYYDFYVQTCWDAAGSGEATALSSIIRLLNPNRIIKEDQSDLKRFTLNYNANGGTSAPGRQQVRDVTASYYDFVISDVVPEYDGAHIFTGWARAKTATSPDYYGGDTIRVTKPSTTLFAVWKQQYQHTLSFKSICPNTTNLPSPMNSPWSLDTSYTFTIADTIPQCSGYQFVGWSTSSTATNPSYSPGDTITVTSNVVLNAVWRRAYVFNLYYDGNGSNVTNLPDSQSSGEISQMSYQFTISDRIPERTNYVFKGWARTSSGSVSYYPGDTLDVTATENTLYAIWQRAYTFTLNYDANGGTGAPTPSTYGPTSESSHTFTISSATPTRPNYTFLGWSVSKTATTPQYRGGNTIKVVANTTLYAVWSRYYVYNLAYDANGGTGAPATQSSGLKSSPGHTFTISSSTPSYTGHEFLGWAMSRDATEPQFSSGSSLSVTTEGTTTIYAVWRPRFKFILSYNANGGSGAPASQDSGYVASYSHTFTISSTTPTYSGYEFMGWSVSSSATTASYQPGGTITIASNTTLYAIWRRINNYILSYDANGGTGAPASQSYTGSNSSATFTISNTKPTRTDYNFIGWSVSKNAKTAEYQSGDTITISGSTVLYAVWRSTHMQDFVCDSIMKRDNITLTDERDSNRYVVKRLDDGNCWMITNLKFGGTTGGSSKSYKLDPSTSDVHTNRQITFYNIEQSTNCEMGSSKSHACTQIRGQDVFYNFPAATAMSITEFSFQESATESICPQGWRLPSKAQFEIINSFWRQFEPWNSEKGTYEDGNSYNYGDGASYWWTSTSSNQTYQELYGAIYDGTALNINFPRFINDGHLVRCIKTP